LYNFVSNNKISQALVKKRHAKRATYFRNAAGNTT